MIQKLRYIALLVTGLVSLTAMPTPAQQIAESCYSQQTAYARYQMNVRRSPTTQSDRVDGIPPGTTVTVLESTQGDTYCWLRLGENRYMAKTIRVYEEKPADLAPPPTHRPVAACDLNRPVGNRPYINYDLGRAELTQAINLLRCHLPSAYDYIQIIDDIYVEDLPRWCGRPKWPYKSIIIANTCLGDIGWLALTLVHEACHLYQWQAGRGRDFRSNHYVYESECYREELKVAEQYQPFAKWIPHFRKRAFCVQNGDCHIHLAYYDG